MKVGVTGCGYLGSRHARKLAARRDVEELLLHDRLPERAAALGRELGAADRDRRSCPRVAVCVTFAELIERSDAVVVAASTDAHAALTLAALEAGRPVLVEKPIAATLEEADRMVARAREAGQVLMVGHVERFNPAVTRLEPGLAAPRFIEAHRLAAFQPRSLDIDVVLDLMIHDIDLVLHFTRELPSRIDAAGTAVLTPRVDIANARLAFPGGCVANLTASRVSLNRTRKIRFFMPETYVSIDLGERRAERYTLEPAGAGRGDAAAAALPGGAPFDPARFMERIRRQSVGGAAGDALEAEQDAFLGAVRGEAPVQVPGEDGRSALAVALRILDRLKEQQI